MVSFRSLFRSVKVCPKTGRITGIRVGWKNALFLFPIMGLAALLWFCVRVIPKPSRIHYPCQQVAVPIASGFLLWLASFTAAVAIFRKSLTLFKHKRIIIGVVCFAMAITFFIVSSIPSARPSYAGAKQAALSTLPIGEAKGIFPGRVVWDRDLKAANQNCTQSGGDYWWMDKNTDSTVVEQMVSDALHALTGTNSDSAAWVALFKYFNKQRWGLDNTGYTAGEKIAIKINLSSAHDMNNPNNMDKGTELDMTDTSPQIMRAILKQLINVVHVAQTDIFIGDPGKPFFNQFFNLIHPHFLQVHYIDVWGNSGRMPATPTAQDVIFYSDRNHPDPNPVFGRHNSDKMPQCFVDARYLINLSPMKGHESAGVSMCAKNHFGSQSSSNLWNPSQGGAAHLHYGLPSNGGNAGYGRYRNLVDLMGHKDLGAKTLLSVIDGLWSGHTSTPDSPNKWKSMGNTYPSSIFMSQDIVAIEAVGLDFLKEEYRAPYYTDTCYLYPSRVNGVDDYLYQAADKANWPATVGGQPFPGYDPEGDGTLIGSLGTFDHWNNAADKQYSRNLDPVNGKGIELVAIGATGVRPGPAAHAQQVAKSKCGSLYSANGRLVAASSSAAVVRSAHLSRGTYIYHTANGESGKYVQLAK